MSFYNVYKVKRFLSNICRYRTIIPSVILTSREFDSFFIKTYDCIAFCITITLQHEHPKMFMGQESSDLQLFASSDNTDPFNPEANDHHISRVNTKYFLKGKKYTQYIDHIDVIFIAESDPIRKKFSLQILYYECLKAVLNTNNTLCQA